MLIITVLLTLGAAALTPAEPEEAVPAATPAGEETAPAEETADPTAEETVSAATETMYELSDLGFSITVPDSYSVQTRDLGDEMPGADVYLVGREENNELWVRMGSNEEIQALGNLSQLSMSEIEEYSRSLLSSVNGTGIYQVNNWRIEGINGVIFVRLDVHSIQEDRTDYGLEYYTIAQGKRLIVSLHNYASPLTVEQSQMLGNMIAAMDLADWAGVDYQPNTPVTSTEPASSSSGQFAAKWERIGNGEYKNADSEYIFIFNEDAEALRGSETIQNVTDAVLKTDKLKPSIVTCYKNNGDQAVIATFVGSKTGKGFADFMAITKDLDLLLDMNFGNAGTSGVFSQLVSYYIFGSHLTPSSAGEWICLILFYLLFYTALFVIVRFLAGRVRLGIALSAVLSYMVVAVVCHWLFTRFIQVPPLGLMALICTILNVLILSAGMGDD